VTVPLHRVRNYEELEGGQGREVFFRPHRYRAADLLPLRSEVLLHGNGSRTCPLLDVSENGVALEWAEDVAVAVGDALPDVGVRFDAHEGYRGRATVGSVRDLNGVTIVGLSLEGMLHVDEVLELRAIKSFADANLLSGETWRAPGHDRFKVLVSELRLYLEDAEVQLKRLESELPWHVLHGEGSPAREALIAQLRNSFVGEVVRQTEAIDASLRSVPPSHIAALKQFSHRHVHDFLMQSPCLHRMLHKPFGYPGDYEMMRFMYEGNFEGATLFAKAVNLAFIGTKAAQAVNRRKDLVKRQLAAMIEARRGADRPFRMLSVAAGPAQELVELLRETEDLAAPLEIVLFDQDKGALAYAWRRLKNVVDAKWQKRVQVLCLNESIKRLLRDRELFSNFGDFDAVFSCGLFDYLQPATAVVLTRNLFARLAPAGKLFIGNMVPENPTRYIMEHHLDWQLIYRPRAEQLDIARRAAPTASLQILEEETGINPFVELTHE
jgi:extracellular factor (EF) 3-hydroxypalmitic acid methyl ester biosynthesis protein